MTPPRYSRVALPRYAHRLGVTPHPATDPRGHGFGHAAESPGPEHWRSPEGWRTCEAFLEGVDLFNAGYWWEAHEAWELLWRSTPHPGPGDADSAEPARQRAFVQGLIQLAAAALQRAAGNQAGVGVLLERAARNLDGAPAGYMGVDAPALLEAARRAAAVSDEAPTAAWPIITLA